MIRQLCLVSLALTAFAANSILCRYALYGESGNGGWIDPASFTAIRLFSGAITLVLLVFIFQRGLSKPARQNYLGAIFLLIYAVTFSFAYISLDTATGALILFGTVQLLMITFSLIKGQRLNKREWIGFSIACCGFLFLTLPHVSAPSWSGLLLMVISGFGWAFYTLNGKGSTQPLMDTALNFSLAIIPALLPVIVLIAIDTELQLSTNGILFAVASGALASGIGYAIWYAVLPSITTTQAATSQLLVPIIAGIGGILLLQEPLSSSLLISGLLILGGVYLVVNKKPV